MTGWPAATLLAAGVVGVAALVAVATDGGTFALLSAQASTDPVTITAGSADLSLSSLTLPTTALWPGDTEFGVLTARNTGDVPLDLSIATARGSAPASTTGTTGTTTAVADLRVAIGASTSVAACRSGVMHTTWTGTLDSSTATTAGISVRPGAAVVLCVGLTMPSSAPASQQGLGTDFTATITGTQASS
ncbi:hypothetical protein [Curtobacterium herbarum]|uniref:Uncharacterized protein n=1 Tax=Curtobacterium herbarum TaxID=150122 RepID=A0ABN1ZFD0_9MICO|nr:hypothetical protein [Curtobacterium herbarum]MBM7476885.1 hypothetical protein [Curtobacterium herbarum]MCS6545104.1 hypothetical protein [Curtobacterium herbarum]